MLACYEVQAKVEREPLVLKGLGVFIQLYPNRSHGVRKIVE